MTEREAIVRLEVLRIKTTHARDKVATADTDAEKEQALRRCIRLHRERVSIVDGLGLGEEIWRKLREEE